MSIGLLGTKIGMTREFMKSGQSVPVTVIKFDTGSSFAQGTVDTQTTKVTLS